MIRLAVRCRPELAERVLAELVVLAPGGVEEEATAEWVEYAIYGAAGELPDLGGVEAAAGDGLVEVRSEEIPDDWGDRWRDYHEPVLVADRVLVRPSWHDAPPDDLGSDRPEVVDVVIDPGNAFGTGAHPTTRMCIELLVAVADERRPGPLADLGTGSGVLAIAAAKLGFGPVIAVDHERASLDAAAANARVNQVELELERVNLREAAPPPADVVVANLTAPLLVAVAGNLESRRLPRSLICSGLLDREAAEVTSAFAGAGLGLRERRTTGDWAALGFAA